jgi:GTP cyclohydrolase II
MSVTEVTYLDLEYGVFKISFHRYKDESCVSFVLGDVTEGSPIVRIHSSCLFGESFHGLDCDCADQLHSTLSQIQSAGKGVVVYQFAEGRGIGLEQKIKSLELQRVNKIDTVEAFKILGYPSDLRTYDEVVQALKDLHVAKDIKVASQNPHKIAALKKAGYNITKLLDMDVMVTEHNRPELHAKKHKLGYEIKDI